MRPVDEHAALLVQGNADVHPLVLGGQLGPAQDAGEFLALHGLNVQVVQERPEGELTHVVVLVRPMGLPDIPFLGPEELLGGIQVVEELDPAAASVAVNDNVRGPGALGGAEECVAGRIKAAVGLLLQHGSGVASLDEAGGVVQPCQKEVGGGPVACLDELPVLVGHLRVRQAVRRVQVV